MEGTDASSDGKKSRAAGYNREKKKKKTTGNVEKKKRQKKCQDPRDEKKPNITHEEKSKCKKHHAKVSGV